MIQPQVLIFLVHLQVVKTHLRNMIIVPEMIGSIIGVYNGKTFNQVEIKVLLHNHHSSFDLVTLTLVFDLHIENFNLGYIF
jgi:hypothetical protein